MHIYEMPYPPRSRDSEQNHPVPQSHLPLCCPQLTVTIFGVSGTASELS